MVDIDVIKRNAAEQGIPLSDVAIVYQGLTDAEKNCMRVQNLITHDNGEIVIAKFTGSGEVFYSFKIKSVLYL